MSIPATQLALAIAALFPTLELLHSTPIHIRTINDWIKALDNIARTLSEDDVTMLQPLRDQQAQLHNLRQSLLDYEKDLHAHVQRVLTQHAPGLTNGDMTTLRQQMTVNEWGVPISPTETHPEYRLPVIPPSPPLGTPTHTASSSSPISPTQLSPTGEDAIAGPSRLPPTPPMSTPIGVLPLHRLCTVKIPKTFIPTDPYNGTHMYSGHPFKYWVRGPDNEAVFFTRKGEEYLTAYKKQDLGKVLLEAGFPNGYLLLITRALPRRHRSVRIPARVLGTLTTPGFLSNSWHHRKWATSNAPRCLNTTSWGSSASLHVISMVLAPILALENVVFPDVTQCLTHYQIKPGSHERAATLVKDNQFIFPEDPSTDTFDNKKPFQHPAILSTLELAYFHGSKSYLKKFPHRFPTTTVQGEAQAMIPKVMIVSIATMIYHCILHAADGNQSFDPEQMQVTYQRLMKVISWFEANGPGEYKAAMIQIFKTVFHHDDPTSEASDSELAGTYKLFNFLKMDKVIG
ncbi:hypothetical protein BD779DRAFT_1678261 [Infundibulicybe gibba]|nr:hypothetical protein BD779DRAFT_1678261 [Infundibulicybe gibba]